MPSNPTPRPALTRADGAVSRPPLRRRATPVPPLSPPPPSPTDVIFGPAGGRPVPPPLEAVRPVEAVEHHEHLDHKAKGKKGKKHDHVKPGPVATVEVVVPLTKPVRRALKAAAAERETTPEELAALVLSAWLER